MPTAQNFKNHARIVPDVPLGVFVPLPRELHLGNLPIDRRRSAARRCIAFLVSIALLLMFLSLRVQVLTVQDRVIRLEMRLRLRSCCRRICRPRIDACAQPAGRAPLRQRRRAARPGARGAGGKARRRRRRSRCACVSGRRTICARDARDSSARSSIERLADLRSAYLRERQDLRREEPAQRARAARAAASSTSIRQIAPFLNSSGWREPISRARELADAGLVTDERDARRRACFSRSVRTCLKRADRARASR